MMRLISSRLHRCYSTHGLSRSSLIEKTMCVFHILACAGLTLQSNWGLHFLISPSASPIPSPMRTTSIVLLVLVYCMDFLSAVYAQQLFYRKSLTIPRRSALTPPVSPPPTPGGSGSGDRYGANPYHSQRPSFLASILSSPAVHDMFVSLFFMLGGCVLLISVFHYHRYYKLHPSVLQPPSLDQERARFVQVRCTVFFAIMMLIGTMMNMILCLPYPYPLYTFPSQAMISGVLCRLHLITGAVFALCASVKLIGLQILEHSMPDPHLGMVHFVTSSTRIADIVVVVFAVVNFLRIWKFSSRTKFWALHEAKRLNHSKSDGHGAIRKTNWFWRLFQSPPSDSTTHDSDFMDDSELPLHHHVGNTKNHSSSGR